MKKIKFKWNGRVVALAFASIALVMLLSVSYAYFVSKVEGNEDAKATDITAGKMELEYDGTSIVGMENALPGDKKVITFTVTNKGTVTTQYNVDLTNVTNGFIKDELVYSIKRNGKDEKGETPLPGSDTTLLEGVSIEKDRTDTYELTIEFKETYSEQNYNQGKEFNGLIQINGYEPKKKPLNEWIIANYPIIEEEPDFNAGCPTSKDDSCSGLYKTTDNEGPSYIFRGRVDNNYVLFAGYTWRIIRVNGDGSIRLVLNGDIGTSAFNSTENAKKYVGYTYDNSHNCTNSDSCDTDSGESSTIKTELENWYNEHLLSNDSKIALTTYCNDTSYGGGEPGSNDIYFGAYQRLINSSSPQLSCPEPMDNYGGVYKLKIGLLTADEVAMAGFKPKFSTGVTQNNYLYYSDSSNNYFWTSSPHSISDGFSAFGFYSSLTDCYLSIQTMNNARGVRPVINLKTDNISYSGTGIEGDPIEIE